MDINPYRMLAQLGALVGDKDLEAAGKAGDSAYSKVMGVEVPQVNVPPMKSKMKKTRKVGGRVFDAAKDAAKDAAIDEGKEMAGKVLRGILKSRGIG